MGGEEFNPVSKNVHQSNSAQPGAIYSFQDEETKAQTNEVIDQSKIPGEVCEEIKTRV
jgi:hypothetical protein